MLCQIQITVMVLENVINLNYLFMASVCLQMWAVCGTLQTNQMENYYMFTSTSWGMADHPSLGPLNDPDLAAIII